MDLNIKHINEYDSLYGGKKKRNAIGNPFQALINHHFDDILIFAIVETVNLNSPSLSGIGDTIFFTNEEEEEKNKSIKLKYQKIIENVENKFEHPLSAYIDWYETDTVFVSGKSETEKKFDTSQSGWRTKLFVRDTETRPKEEYGLLRWDENDKKKTFKKHIEEYFAYYIKLLREELSFNDFPYFTVIAKSISLPKKQTEIIKLGNLYLHLATTVEKDEAFFHRLLNDFLLIWTREEASVIIKHISAEAVDQADKENTIRHNTHLPAIWALKNNKQFSKSEIDKLGKPLGSSGIALNKFYDEVFIYNSMNCYSDLVAQEKRIIDELIPILLKNKGWLKDGVTVERTNTFINSIKKNVEHKEFKAFTKDYVYLFTTLLTLRHIVNVCFCCFGYEVDQIHSFLSTGDITNEDKSSLSYASKLTAYFSKLFFYSPQEAKKNITKFDKKDAFTSASVKERDFMRACAAKISLLIKGEKLKEYNKTAHSELQLDSIALNKFNNDYISKLAVFDFKRNWCNENEIIPKLLKEKAGKYLIAPILDCGAGLGDIAYKAFPDKEAILIDVNPIEDKETPISPLHRNIVKSIFDFYPERRINTLLISHTLQFIDTDIELLNNHIQILNPLTIILVSNMNDDIMGDILSWTKENYANSNPEERIAGFPRGYECIEEIKFKANLKCQTFSQLANQISYLMMFDISDTGDQMVQFLKTRLSKPEFDFNQVIEVFQKAKS